MEQISRFDVDEELLNKIFQKVEQMMRSDELDEEEYEFTKEELETIDKIMLKNLDIFMEEQTN